MAKIFDHIYIFSTIIFTVYSQIIMRWQVSHSGPLPESLIDKLNYICVLLINPWVITSIISTFLAGVSWMLAMTKFEISYAFPFVSLNYVFILIVGVLFFGEYISFIKLVGCLIVVVGILVIAKG